MKDDLVWEQLPEMFGIALWFMWPAAFRRGDLAVDTTRANFGLSVPGAYVASPVDGMTVSDLLAVFLDLATEKKEGKITHFGPERIAEIVARVTRMTKEEIEAEQALHALKNY